MNYFSYRFSLSKLNRQRSKIDKSYKKQYDEAKKEKDEEKKQEISSLAIYELDEIDDEILFLEHQYLRSISTKHLIQVPPVIEREKGGLWERSRYNGKYRLTNEGIRQLRSEIRKERKERTELLARWISILIGLLGAITGLVAVIKN